MRQNRHAEVTGLDATVGAVELDLDGLLADAAAHQVARDRVGERMLRQAAEEEATFTGVLVDLAERRDVVTIRTSGGRSLRGIIRAVGRDFVIVRDSELPPAFVAFAAIASIRSPSARGSRPDDVAGSRSAPIDATLAVVLSGLAADRPRVHVAVEGEAASLVGELRAVGRDVVTLRLDADQRPTLLLPISAVREVVLLDL
jgi:hypothetical protein